MRQNFIYGVDVGLLAQLEQQGVTWKDKNGNNVDALRALYDMGANAVRMRVFVDPPKTAIWHKPPKTAYGRSFGEEDVLLGFCDEENVVKMAQRAKELGMRFMVDFHYSDHFADPVYQDIPRRWEKDDILMLTGHVQEHTIEMLSLLRQEGITVDWAQVGNEINAGILLPVGSSGEAPDKMVALLNAGYDAVKQCMPECQVVTHLSGGNDYKACCDFYDRFFKYGGRTDVLGLSYYPYWVKIVHDENHLKKDLITISARYGKPVMLSEIGAPESEEKESYQMLRSAIRAIRDVPNGQGLGLFYWEPEVGADLLPDHYPLGAAVVTGSKEITFTKAIRAFKDSVFERSECE